MQTARPKIWTLSISYDDNHYITSTTGGYINKNSCAFIWLHYNLPLFQCPVHMLSLSITVFSVYSFVIGLSWWLCISWDCWSKSILTVKNDTGCCREEVISGVNSGVDFILCFLLSIIKYLSSAIGVTFGIPDLFYVNICSCFLLLFCTPSLFYPMSWNLQLFGNFSFRVAVK